MTIGMICINTSCIYQAETQFDWQCKLTQEFSSTYLCDYHTKRVRAALYGIQCNRHPDEATHYMTLLMEGPIIKETAVTHMLPESASRTIKSVLIEQQAYKLSKADGVYMRDNPSELIALLTEIAHITQALIDLQHYENLRFGGGE